MNSTVAYHVPGHVLGNVIAGQGIKSNELSCLLTSVEQRAAIVFKRGSAELHRNRKNEIRNDVAMQHKAGTKAVDPTVSVMAEDPELAEVLSK